MTAHTIERTPGADHASAPGGRVPPRPPGIGAGLLVGLALLAGLIGAAITGFVTFSAEPANPLPTIVVPADDEVRALQSTAASAPDDAAAQQALGVAATRHAIATADPAWYAIAVQALDTAAELDPDDPLTTIARGQLALSLHDFDHAQELGLAATAAAPGNADAWGVLVDAHVELGAYDAAAEALSTMVELDPGLPALARVSYLRQLNGDLDGATTAMRQAEVAGGGNDPSVSALLGDLLLHHGDIVAAEAAYQRSSTPAAAAGLARVAMARGDLDRAETILTALVQRAPAPPVVLALAEVQQRQGDQTGLDDTVELARTIATLQQDAGQTVDLELAIFEASFGDPRRAVRLAEIAHEARPDNVYASGALAWARHRAGRSGAATLALAASATRLGAVDTAHELRMADVVGGSAGDVEARNPLARELFVP